MRVEGTDRAGTLARAGLPGRYAAALFDLAAEGHALDETDRQLADLAALARTDADMARLLRTPGIARSSAAAAVAAVADELQLSPLVRRFVQVVAGNGRLAQLPDIIAEFQAMVRQHRGFRQAEVTVARPLTADQQGALADKLRSMTGHDMDLAIRCDPAILGGLVVRIGSRQIDASVRSRLERLGQQMKGL